MIAENRPALPPAWSSHSPSGRNLREGLARSGATQGADFVWVVAESKVQRRPVTLGVRTPGFVEVMDGVKSGEQVVTGGLELLAPGAPVMPRVVERKG